MEPSQLIVLDSPMENNMRQTGILATGAHDSGRCISDTGGVMLEGKGFWHRASSYILDCILMNVLGVANVITAAMLLALVNALASPDLIPVRNTDVFDTAVSIASFIVYFSIFEWLFGATPGKAISKLRVVMLDGSPCTIAAALARGGARLVDGLMFGLVAALNMRYPQNQRWGDKIAHTLVVSSNDPGIRQSLSWWRFGLAAIVFWALQSLIILLGFLWFA